MDFGTERVSPGETGPVSPGGTGPVSPGGTGGKSGWPGTVDDVYADL